METRNLGPLGPVSILALGGGGIGQIWGETTRKECVATARAAVDDGITLLDMAARYGDGEAEDVIGEAFEGRLPDGVRVTTKCQLGETPPAEIEARLRDSLAGSLKRLRVERVDVFFLHSNIVPDDHPMREHPDASWRMTPRSQFEDAVRPALERLVADGLAGAWGITGIGHPDVIMEVLNEDPAPAVVQAITNPLNSPGGLKFFKGPSKAREIIATAKARGIGVMGIRAVQAGAFTDQIDRPLPDDHPEMRDYRITERYRNYAGEQGILSAILAHRYAIAMDGVDTVVLGVKDRDELADCVGAANAPPLPQMMIEQVDACFSF